MYDEKQETKSSVIASIELVDIKQTELLVLLDLLSTINCLYWAGYARFGKAVLRIFTPTMVHLSDGSVNGGGMLQLILIYFSTHQCPQHSNLEIKWYICSCGISLLWCYFRQRQEENRSLIARPKVLFDKNATSVIFLMIPKTELISH